LRQQDERHGQRFDLAHRGVSQETAVLGLTDFDRSHLEVELNQFFICFNELRSNPAWTCRFQLTLDRRYSADDKRSAKLFGDEWEYLSESYYA
jgi:hypothetical protein